MHYYIVDYPKKNTFVRTGNLYVNREKFTVKVKDSDGLILKYTILPGFTTDGGSVPGCFSWFMPSWSETNMLLNVAFLLHDCNYGAEYISKDLADDMLRGLLRDAGYNRFHASTVCWAVNTFAHSHYGEENDKWNCKKFSKFDVDYK